MATTFFIDGTPFEALDGTAGRKALACRVDAAHYRLRRFHAPGVDGNFIIRQGRDGSTIMCRMRYNGTEDAAKTLFETDRQAWRNAAVSIIDDIGTDYASCNLINMTIIRDPRGRSNGPLQFFDAIALFTWDG